MRFIAGPLNKQLLQNLLNQQIEECTRVRAAVAYASRDNMQLFQACLQHSKPLEYYGRYDHTVPVDPPILKWFLERASPNLRCHLVPDILHSKVIWWVDAGAYIGSANLSDRAWISNIEAGTFFSHNTLVETGMDQELLQFFEQIEDRSHPLTQELYSEQLRLSEQRAGIDRDDHGVEKEFNKGRLLPKDDGLVSVRRKDRAEERFRKFEEDWNATLQTMRTIATRVSTPENRPSWISESVPAGVQADQFLHAYYYKQVRDGNRHPYEEFHTRNSKNPERALQDALKWWKAADFDHEFEEKTIYGAPHLQSLLAKDRIRQLTEDDFIDAISRVHAIRDHAVKQKNVDLNLPDSPQLADDKVQKFGERLWRTRSAGGKSILELLEYNIWGYGNVATRLWKSVRDEQWRIPHIGLSSLGEIIGWARPDEFPPRNMRTNKALRALGYTVRIDV